MMDAILSDVVKTKLADMCHGCNKCPRAAFTQLLALRLPSIVTATTFVTSGLFLVHDLMKGVTNEHPLYQEFSDMPPFVYSALIDELPLITEKVLPKNMAESAKEYLARLQHSVEVQELSHDETDALAMALTLAGHQLTVLS